MEHIGLQLKRIFFEKKTGQLVFDCKNIHKNLFFLDGSLVYVKTNQRHELLGEVLFKLGKISDEVHSKIYEFVVPKKGIGEILVEKNLISPGTLKEGLMIQMREVVMNMFPFFDGSIRFQDSMELNGPDFDVKLDASNLLEKGIRRMRYHPALKKFFENEVPVLGSRTFYYHLTEEEKEILEKIDWKSSAGTLLETLDVKHELYWKSLFLFYCLGLIGKKGEDHPEKPKVKLEEKPKEPETVPKGKNIDEIIELSDRLEKMNYYELLDVPEDADPAQVKKAYFKMARGYHPDLYLRDITSDIRGKIENVFDAITKAYRTLSDENNKDDYDQMLVSKPDNSRQESGNKAKTRYLNGKALFEQTRYNEAIVYLEEAVRLDPNKASYFLLLAKTQAKFPAYIRKAEKSFRTVIQMEPWNPEAYYWLGMMYKKEGLDIKAKKQFESVLNIDSNHKEALKELGRSAKTGGKKGLMDFIPVDLLSRFGKKKKK